MAGFVFPDAPPWAASVRSVGVTGTNGKTSTARLLSSALRAPDHPVLSVTTVGVFLDDEPWGTLQTHQAFVQAVNEARQRGCDRVVVETTSEALAIGFARAWPLCAGVFTNLSHDHLDQHRTPEHYLASKAQLFVHLQPGGVAVLNARDPVESLLREVIPHDVRVVRYAGPSGPETEGLVDVQARDGSVTWDGSRAVVHVKVGGADREMSLSVPLLGEVFLDNAVAALATAIALGVDPTYALASLARASHVEGRFERVCTVPHVVIDYAHTPDALQRTLQTARALAIGQVVVVFGAGGDRDPNKRAAMGAAAYAADRVVLTSDNPRSEDPMAIVSSIASGLRDHPSVHVELDRARAIDHAVTTSGDHDVVVVAGKGHERTQSTGERVVPFSDRDAVLRAVAHRRGGS